MLGLAVSVRRVRSGRVAEEVVFDVTSRVKYGEIWQKSTFERRGKITAHASLREPVESGAVVRP